MNTDFTIQHYEHNPRQITKNQFARLKETMREFGDLSGIVINLRLGDDGKEIGELVGGNQRSEAGAFIHSKPTIEKEYDPPLEDGTVAEGYFDYDGRKFNARFVRWDADKVLRANLIANIAGGDWDWDVLANVSADILDETGFNFEFLRARNQDANSLRQLIMSESPPDDPLELWQGMPEFEQKDLTSFRSIHIHFSSQEDVDKFSGLINQVIGEKTRSIWYPPVEKINMRDTYENES